MNISTPTKFIPKYHAFHDKSSSSDWAENLAESNEGLLLWPGAMTENEQPRTKCDPSISTSTFSTRQSKNTVEWRSRKRKHWHIATASWPRYRSRWKTAGEDQRIGDLSLLSWKRWTCGKFTNSVPLACSGESCPSPETSLNAFPTTEKSRAFAINRASVLGFRAIGGGHASASRVFSFLGQYAWSENFELTNLW